MFRVVFSSLVFFLCGLFIGTYTAMLPLDGFTLKWLKLFWFVSSEPVGLARPCTLFIIEAKQFLLSESLTVYCYNP